MKISYRVFCKFRESDSTEELNFIFGIRSNGVSNDCHRRPCRACGDIHDELDGGLCDCMRLLSKQDAKMVLVNIVFLCCGLRVF